MRIPLLAFTLALSVPIVAAAAPSSTDNEKALRTLFEEGVNQGHLELLDGILAEDFVEHEALPGYEPGREGVKQWFAAMRSAFPDLRFDVVFTMVDGDKVAAYMTVSGTQKAEFLGMPSKGNRFSVSAVDIVRFENGKVVEHWGVTDSAGMMRQLSGEDGQPSME